MKSLIRHLQKFFTIDNSFLFVSFLIIIVLSRFSVTYFNDSNRAVAPDVNFYAGENVGHDLIYATTQQAYRLLDGLPMEIGVGYGYSFTVLTAWVIQFFEGTGTCHQEEVCQFVFYRFVVVLSLLGLFSLPFLLVKEKAKRVTVFLFLITFLLGVPGGMGLESGNLDILLSVIYGIMLYFHRTSLADKKNSFYPLLLGVFAGLILQAKLFLLPLVLIFLFCSTKRLHFLVSLVLTMGVISVIPWFYNVPINPLFTLQAAHYLGNSVDFSSGIVYGNNSTRAMVGGIIFEFPMLYKNPQLRNALIPLGGGLLFVSVLVLPLISFLPKIRRRIGTVFSERESLHFFIVLNCYALTGMILWPEVSLSYRLYYLVPLLFLLLDIAKLNFTKHTLALALSALVVRSLFLWNTRFLHIFLLLFFYFLIEASLSVWLNSPKTLAKARR